MVQGVTLMILILKQIINFGEVKDSTKNIDDLAIKNYVSFWNKKLNLVKKNYRIFCSITLY